MQCFNQPSPAAMPTGAASGRQKANPNHGEKKIFQGNADTDPGPANNFVSTIWDFFFKTNDRTPDGQIPVHPVDLSYFNCPTANQMNVTWLGHSTLLINIDGTKVLTDPVFEKRVSIFGPTRFNGEVPLDIHQVPPIDVIIISHDHYDHLNKYSVRQLHPKTRKFIVPLGVGARLVNWGVPQEKIVELDSWAEYRFDHNLTIAATPARHFSGRGLADRNKTLWASWVIRTPWHNLFFSGDSGYFSGFRQIGEKYGPFDMTFIECGAYSESWATVHMFPEQTVQAHLDLGGNILHPVHWGTFNLAMHPWYEPMERASTAAAAAGISLATPMPGETTLLNGRRASGKWWQMGKKPFEP